jgi:hypothetical protein
MTPQDTPLFVPPEVRDLFHMSSPAAFSSRPDAAAATGRAAGGLTDPVRGATPGPAAQVPSATPSQAQSQSLADLKDPRGHFPPLPGAKATSGLSPQDLTRLDGATNAPLASARPLTAPAMPDPTAAPALTRTPRLLKVYRVRRRRG